MTAPFSPIPYREGALRFFWRPSPPGSGNRSKPFCSDPFISASRWDPELSPPLRGRVASTFVLPSVWLHEGDTGGAPFRFSRWRPAFKTMIMNMLPLPIEWNSTAQVVGHSSGRAVLWVTFLHGSESTCVCDASERVRKSCRQVSFFVPSLTLSMSL
jgi:hypothetical protein